MTESLYNSFTSSINSILLHIKERSPLIHCITNPISINDCANSILALGGRPIMAEHPNEVCEITKSSCALCLNIGNITDARMESIILSAKTAADWNIPSVLDVVGITCSNFRYEFVNEFLKISKPTVIKGNLSEIKKLAHIHSDFIGVDSSESVDCLKDLNNAVILIKGLAKCTGSIVVASGKTDIISDGTTTAACWNGSPYLPLVTGTGCMLNVIIGTMLSAKDMDIMNRTLLGVAVTGICGELSEEYTMTGNNFAGLGTYHINLINALSTFTSEDIKKRLRIKFF